MQRTSTPTSGPEPQRVAYKVPEVAKKFGVSDWTVRMLIANGRLRAINVGVGTKQPLYIIPAEAVDEFLEGDR